MQIILKRRAKRLIPAKEDKELKEAQGFIEFEGANRHDYPCGLVCVTEGQNGGEATLIKYAEKNVLHDCGMAYSAEETISNIKKELDGENLDYILVSHTHYDHIGALPYIKKAFPGVRTVGSAYGQYVLTRPGALKVIKSLGESAAAQYGTGNEDITTDGMGIDIVLADGEKLDIGMSADGPAYITALETKGHTDCAMTYVIEPCGIMLACESTGICVGPMKMDVAILKSFDDSIASLEKCRNYGAKRIISPHYGIVPESYNETYWKLFEEMAWDERNYVVGMWNSGLSPEQMLEKTTKEVFEGGRGKEQPYDAFVANTTAIIKVYEKYADPDKKYKCERE